MVVDRSTDAIEKTLAHIQQKHPKAALAGAGTGTGVQAEAHHQSSIA